MSRIVVLQFRNRLSPREWRPGVRLARLRTEEGPVEGEYRDGVVVSGDGEAYTVVEPGAA